MAEELTMAHFWLPAFAAAGLALIFVYRFFAKKKGVKNYEMKILFK